MKIFIDLGAYNGDTLKGALKLYKNFDIFYAFEPLPENFEKLDKTFGNAARVVLLNAAADVEEGEKKFYLANNSKKLGGSLCSDKSNCFKDKTELVKTVDISKFIMDKFTPKDKIILKMDVEGKEYDILEKMIKDGSIRYINRLFCEWHYKRLSSMEDRHENTIKRLNKLGFRLTGENKRDEFRHVLKRWERIDRLRFYFNKLVIRNRASFVNIIQLVGRYLKRNCPKFYYLLKGIKTGFLRYFK